MAYRIEGQDIVVDGWENGISDNPYKGIQDMRGVNIISVPGEVSVGYKSTLASYAKCTGSVVSANTGTEIVTVTISTGNLDLSYSGQAVIFTGASLPTGLTAGTVYWIVPQNSTSFLVYSDYNLVNLVNITATGTGIFSTVDMGETRYTDKNNPYSIDTNGRVWGLLNSVWRYLGNTELTNASGNGICLFISSVAGWDGNKYLFIFRNSRIDYLNIQTYTWVYSWDPATGATNNVDTLNSPSGYTGPHEAIIDTNGRMFYTDSNYLGALEETDGQIFDPTNTATYLFQKKAYTIKNDEAQSIEQLGLNILIGGKYNYVYSWDTITFGGTPMKISDNFIYKLLTINTNTYIFAGKRGRIYYTNGSQAQLYTKVPDNISNGIEPTFSWKGVAYNKNQIYFGITATLNGTAITKYNGLWAVDITTNGLRVPVLCSTTNAEVSAINVNDGGVTTGYSLYIFWKSGSTYGVDSSQSSDPNLTYISYIDADIIPIGTFLGKRTLNNLEFKLSVPMVNGEGIRISYRTNLTGTYTVIGETLATASYTPLSDMYTVNFDQSQWLQLRIEMKSTATNPSYVRLRELRIR